VGTDKAAENWQITSQDLGLKPDSVLIDRNDLPKNLFGISGSDLSEDQCAEALAGLWFRLGHARSLRD
jgi:hypothetical protein